MKLFPLAQPVVRLFTALALVALTTICMAQWVKGGGGVVNFVVRLAAGLVPMTRSPGEAAELWYLAQRKWSDESIGHMRYCVFPRIEVNGSRPWTDPFEIQLLRGRETQPLATVLVPQPLPVGTSRELGSPPTWCVTSPDVVNPPVLYLKTSSGRVRVEFGPAPKR